MFPVHVLKTVQESQQIEVEDHAGHLVDALVI